MQSIEKLEALPQWEKINPAAALHGKRTCRPYCRCCGGASGIRAAFRKAKKAKLKGKKPWKEN